MAEPGRPAKGRERVQLHLSPRAARWLSEEAARQTAAQGRKRSQSDVADDVLQRLADAAEAT